MTFKQPETMFTAAVSYARGKMEAHPGIAVHMRLDALGIAVIADNVRDLHCRRVVSWHDLEHTQYDALRHAIDGVVLHVLGVGSV